MLLSFLTLIQIPNQKVCTKNNGPSAKNVELQKVISVYIYTLGICIETKEAVLNFFLAKIEVSESLIIEHLNP